MTWPWFRNTAVAVAGRQLDADGRGRMGTRGRFVRRLRNVVSMAAPIVLFVFSTGCARDNRDRPRGVRSAESVATAVERLTASGHGYRVEVVSRDVVPHDGDWVSPPWGEDASWRRPWRAVEAIRIWKGEQSLVVPRSVFADLAEVNSASVGPLQGGCIVALEGGDAATAWHAYIRVTGIDITERHVEVAEFPDTYEKTTYVVGTPEPGE